MKQMTIEEFHNNPAGVGSAAIPNRDAIKADYARRLANLRRTKPNAFKVETFVNGEDYYLLVVIPSEDKERNNTYDVVFKFSADKDIQGSTSVKNYNVQVFSNSPSFVYTYAYVFDKEGMLVPELKSKFRDETFDPPTTRNPYESISYEKTTFMATQYILDSTVILLKDSFKGSKGLSALQSTVRTPDKVHIEISTEKTKLKEIEERVKRDDKRTSQSSTSKTSKFLPFKDDPNNTSVRNKTSKKITARKPSKPKGKVKSKKSNR